MEPNQLAPMAGMISVIVVLAKVIEHLIMRKFRKNTCPVISEISEMHSMLKKTDNEGAKLIYKEKGLNNALIKHMAQDELEFERLGSAVKTIAKDQVSISDNLAKLSDKVVELIVSQTRLTDKISNLIERLGK